MSGDRPDSGTFATPMCVVLLVDDDERVRTAVARMISFLGCTVVTADSVAAARRTCASRPRLDLAIVDVDLGDGLGTDLIDELRDHLGDEAPPFVILSGRQPERRPGGVVQILQKPIGFAELQTLLKAIGRAPPVERSSAAPGRTSLARVAPSMASPVRVLEEPMSPGRRDPRC